MIKKTDRLFLLPALLGFLLFWVIPFFASFGYAFIDNNFSRRFVGMQNMISVKVISMIFSLVELYQLVSPPVRLNEHVDSASFFISTAICNIN